MVSQSLERDPPPFFRQGPTAFSRLIFFSALAIFLMVADVRMNITSPIRSTVATVLYPVQWAIAQPAAFWNHISHYFNDLTQTKIDITSLRGQLLSQAENANQVKQLQLENIHLRQLLGLRDRFQTRTQAAEVLYDAADPFSRKIILDIGTSKGIQLGSPVIDEAGLIGQVTRTYPLISEVTLVSDRQHATPVLNARTGARSVAYGDSSGAGNNGIELRFMAANADVQQGDVLMTSGLDGVYPPGLPVAKVARVERRADSSFARIYCTPMGGVDIARHTMVLDPLTARMPSRPEPVAIEPPRQQRPLATKQQ